MLNNKYSVFSLQKRIIAITSIILFLFLVVIVKLFTVQILSGTILQRRALSQWTRDLTMSGLRGDITDRNGDILASSHTSYNVYVRGSNVKDAELVALSLSEILGVDYEKTLGKAKNRRISESLIKSQIDYEDAKIILSKNLAGVYLSETSSRHYNYDNMLCNVLGFCTVDNQGQAGLEAFYNGFLQGINGSSYTESDITGLELSSATTYYTTGIKGCTVELTIDLGIQQILQSVVEQAKVEQKAEKAQAVIIDATNGEILAMASSKNFDLNNPPRDDAIKLMGDSKNTMITDVYEPGSTFKLFTIASALEEGITDLDEKFYDPGYRIVDGQKIKCWKTKGHGSQTLVDGVCNSCNSVFMDLGLRMGKDTFYSYLKKFGIGNKTGVDFSGESSGIMMNVDSVKNVDLARISFGQAIAVTPMQMATSVAGILTGTLYEPRFIKSITTANGVKKDFNSLAKTKTVRAETSEKILYMMEQVVSKSDGLYSFVPGYRIGGKTGTAQKYENGVIATGKYVSSFIGCYPVQNPKYVMLLCVDEPSGEQYYGSLVAAPYAKQIFSQMFDYLGIEPTNLTEDLKKLTKTIEMPNLVGVPLSEGAEILKSLKLQYEIDGDDSYIKWQSVPPGELLYEGEIVLLKM